MLKSNLRIARMAFKEPLFRENVDMWEHPLLTEEDWKKATRKLSLNEFFELKYILGCIISGENFSSKNANVVREHFIKVDAEKSEPVLTFAIHLKYGLLKLRHLCLRYVPESSFGDAISPKAYFSSLEE